jgi:hypothetical protein
MKIFRPTAQEYGHALCAIRVAKSIVDAHVEHRPIKADEIQEFYIAFRDWESNTMGDQCGDWLDMVNSRISDMFETNLADEQPGFIEASEEKWTHEE